MRWIESIKKMTVGRLLMWSFLTFFSIVLLAYLLDRLTGFNILTY